MPPFPLVRESLESMQGKADVMVGFGDPARGSRTRMVRARAAGQVALLAGQELGSKQEHLALAAGGRYEPDKILMVGDAFGDWDAATAKARSSTRSTPAARMSRGSGSSREALPRFFAGTLRRRIHGRPARPLRGCCPNGRRGNTIERPVVVRSVTFSPKRQVEHGELHGVEPDRHARRCAPSRTR